MKRKILKTLALLMAVALLAGVAACGGSAPAPAPAPAPAAPAPAPAPAAPAPAPAPAAPAPAPEQPADPFPEKPITIINTASAGGSMEIGERQLQPFLEKALGVPIQIEFHSGGSSTIGTKAVLAAPHDCYTVLGSGIPMILFGPMAMDVDYDSITDLVPIGPYMRDPAIIRAMKDAPFNDLNEMIAYARSIAPKQLNISVPALSDPYYYSLKMIEKEADIKFNIVNFGSGNDARLALLAGDVDVTGCALFGTLDVASETKVLAIHMNKNDFPEISDNAKTVNEQLGSNLIELYKTDAFWITKKAHDAYPQRYEFLVKAWQEALSDPGYIAVMKEAGDYGKSIIMDPQEYYQSYVKINEELLKERETILAG